MSVTRITAHATDLVVSEFFAVPVKVLQCLVMLLITARRISPAAFSYGRVYVDKNLFHLPKHMYSCIYNRKKFYLNLSII